MNYFCPFSIKITDLKDHSFPFHHGEKWKKMETTIETNLVNQVTPANTHTVLPFITDNHNLINIYQITFQKSLLKKGHIHIFSIKCSHNIEWIFLNVSDYNFLNSKTFSYLPNLCQWKQTRKPTSHILTHWQ